MIAARHPLVGTQCLPGRACDRIRHLGRHLCGSRVPLDAIPDLSDVQVIVYTEYPGQAPQVVEDQVTYPLDHRDAERAEVARSARVLVLWRVVRLRDFRGWH